MWMVTARAAVDGTMVIKFFKRPRSNGMVQENQHSNVAGKRWIRRGLVAGVFLGTVSFPLWSGAFSTQEGREGAPEGRPAGQEAPEGQQDMEAMMQAFAEAAEPGEEHALLATLVGEWAATAQFSMPGGEEMQSEGKSSNQMVMGGRFLLQNFTGEMMGQPFKGISYTGYDNLAEKYQGVWMDEMATGIWISEGEADENGKILTFTGEAMDPLTRQPMPFKHVLTIDGQNKHFFDLYQPGPDGEMMKMGRITYERVE